jgi:hypothetical protein
MPTHPARFRLWLAVLAGTLAAVLLVEALRPKASVPAPVQANTPVTVPVAAPSTVAAAVPADMAPTPIAIPTPVAKPAIAKIASKSTIRHAHRRHKHTTVVAKAVVPSVDSTSIAPVVALSKDTAVARPDSLVAAHNDSCVDGVAFVANDSLATKTPVLADSLAAPEPVAVLRQNAPEIAATAPRPCLQLPKTPEAIKPEAPQAILLPFNAEKTLQ